MPGYESGGIQYLVEASRVKPLALDAAAFPTAVDLKSDANLGRLNVTKTPGDICGDGDYDALYSFGARSFSVWNLSGILLFDSGNDLDKKAKTFSVYPDARSDDKGVEPEGIALGEVNKRQLAFIGMERANAVAIYDVTNPLSPIFYKF